MAILSGGASAQGVEGAKALVSIQGDGSELFRTLLKLEAITPIDEKELSERTHFEDAIVIVLGDPNAIVARTAFTAGFYAQMAAHSGGAVLIASNKKFSGEFFGLATVQIAGESVECSDENAILRKRLIDCPFVVPVRRERFEGAAESAYDVYKLFDGDGERLSRLERVSAADSSFLTLIWKNGDASNRRPLHLLARFPKNSVYKFERKSVPLPRNAAFAIGGEWSHIPGLTSRLLVLGSSRTFNNGMLREEGDDNLEWTHRAIDYLQGPDKRRRRCLFIENGYVVERFDDPRITSKQKPPLPMPNLGNFQDKIVDLGNQVIDRIQTNDVLNNLLLRNFRYSAIATFLFAAAAVLGIYFLMQRAAKARKPTDAPPPLKIREATSQPPGIFDRRQKELLRRDNVSEPVRDTIRSFFASVGIRGDEGTTLPKLAISDAVRKPDSLRIAIADFWKLAFGKTQKLTVKRWQQMEPYFERVRTAHAEGKWAFAFEKWDGTEFESRSEG